MRTTIYLSRIGRIAELDAPKLAEASAFVPDIRRSRVRTLENEIHC